MDASSVVGSNGNMAVMGAPGGVTTWAWWKAGHGVCVLVWPGAPTSTGAPTGAAGAAEVAVVDSGNGQQINGGV